MVCAIFVRFTRIAIKRRTEALLKVLRDSVPVECSDSAPYIELNGRLDHLNLKIYI